MNSKRRQSKRYVPRKKRTTKSARRRPSRGPNMFKPTEAMSLTQLQNMAKKQGIPFGGLNKARLVKKLNDYA